MFSEANLRDQIKDCLDLIEPGLIYIQKEYYINNEIGTSAFFDILAKDKQDNLVIIEVKKSKSTEREALTELFKYIALLKRTKALKDSEVRLIVISTDWRELLLPFSEFVQNTSYNSLGLKAIVDDKGSLESIEKVNILNKKFDRKISRRHWLQLYERKKIRDKRSKEFASSLLKIGLKNFLILKFSYEHPYVPNKTEYGFYFAQQEEELSFYIDIINNNSLERYEELCEYTDDMIAEDKLDEFADAIKDFCHVAADEMEIAHPEKFKGYYEQDKWHIEKIVRYGSYKSEYLSDETILFELCGYTGSSYNWYANVSTNSNNSLLQEIRDNYKNCLYHNDYWQHVITDILGYIQNKKNKCSFIITIYNPEDIFQEIAYYIKDNNPNFLPSFSIIIDEENNDEMEIFEGSIYQFQKKEIDFNNFTEKFFDNDMSSYLFMRHFGEQKSLNVEMMYELGLEYGCSYSSIMENETTLFYESVIVKNEEVKKGYKKYISNFIDFIEEHKEIQYFVLELYKTHSDFFHLHNNAPHTNQNPLADFDW